MKRHAWASSTRKSRLPPNWPKIRAAILARDGGICHVCRLPGADQVDHVIAGDDHRDENLAAIHGYPCHQRKSSAEGHAHRPKTKRPPEQHPGLLRAGRAEHALVTLRVGFRPPLCPAPGAGRCPQRITPAGQSAQRFQISAPLER